MKTEVKELNVTSPAFQNSGNIPSKYTCDGEGINPPIQIDKAPEGTKTLALIVEDPDAPNGTFDHWIVWNIDPSKSIKEHSNPGVSGKNSAGKTGYTSPCPPSGAHRYYFNVYALNDKLDLPPGSDKSKLTSAMQPHILAKGSIMGRYQRSK
jgi:Raf kinase inhibitor-like YbhB/YbcL family protein